MILFINLFRVSGKGNGSHSPLVMGHTGEELWERNEMKQNPFQALMAQEWIEVVVWPPAAATALATSDHIQFLGPAGSGKTSLLLACHAQIKADSTRSVALEYLPEGERHRRTELAGLDVFLLDEAQRLSGWERWRWIAAANRQTMRTIFTSHRDLTALFRLYRLPLITIRLDEPTPEYMQTMLERRLAYFNDSTTFTAPAYAWLWQQFAPYWRDMEFFLYEVWQRWGDKSTIGVNELNEMLHFLTPEKVNWNKRQGEGRVVNGQ